MRFLGFQFGGWAQQRAQQEAERYSRHIEAMRDIQTLHELLAAERAEKAAAEELLAAEKLRNADLTRRLDRLQAEVDRKSAMPGDHRYWEGRYRDEAAQTEALREQITRMQADCDAAEEIDEAWAASPYPDNRKHLSLAEQMSSLDSELESLRDENATLKAAVANAEMDGPKRTLEKANDAQAARAMSRNTKQHFVAYQHAVKMILDRIDTLAQKNHVTKEDLRKLRQLREDLSAQINRTI